MVKLVTLSLETEKVQCPGKLAPRPATPQCLHFFCLLPLLQPDLPVKPKLSRQENLPKVVYIQQTEGSFVDEIKVMVTARHGDTPLTPASKSL